MTIQITAQLKRRRTTCSTLMHEHVQLIKTKSAKQKQTKHRHARYYNVVTHQQLPHHILFPSTVSSFTIPFTFSTTLNQQLSHQNPNGTTTIYTTSQ